MAGAFERGGASLRRLARELLASVDEDEESGSADEVAAAWGEEIRVRDEQVLAGGGGALRVQVGAVVRTPQAEVLRGELAQDELLVEVLAADRERLAGEVDAAGGEATAGGGGLALAGLLVVAALLLTG